MITDIEEETQDIDWFGADLNGEIAHFTSGGRGFLPPSVKACKEDLNLAYAYFRHELAANGYGIQSSNLLLHMKFQSVEQKATYLADYLRMASKGLYSFDCVITGKRPSGYFVVASPARPLSVNELPNEIQKIVVRTRFSDNSRRSEVVQTNAFT